jgi:hypothetical protein
MLTRNPLRHTNLQPGDLVTCYYEMAWSKRLRDELAFGRHHQDELLIWAMHPRPKTEHDGWKSLSGGASLPSSWAARINRAVLTVLSVSAQGENNPWDRREVMTDRGWLVTSMSTISSVVLISRP